MRFHLLFDVSYVRDHVSGVPMFSWWECSAGMRKKTFGLFTIYTGKPVGLPFGSVWANGKKISVLGKFRSGLALTICRDPYHLPKICTTATAKEKVAKQKL